MKITFGNRIDFKVSDSEFFPRAIESKEKIELGSVPSNFS